MKKLWLLPCVLFFIACNKPNRTLYPDDASLRTVPVFVVSHGWHTGIAFEEGYIRDRLPGNRRIPDGDYLMFEWGDGKYFPHNDPGFGLLLRAALLPTTSVLQVTGMHSRPDFSFPNSTVIQINFTPEGVRQLSEFISEQFRKGPEGYLIYSEEGLYPNSSFFEGKRLYFFPRTSNSWTARALRKTGYPIQPTVAFTAENVIKQAKKEGIVLQQD